MRGRRYWMPSATHRYGRASRWIRSGYRSGRLQDLGAPASRISWRPETPSTVFEGSITIRLPYRCRFLSRATNQLRELPTTDGVGFLLQRGELAYPPSLEK